MDIVIHHFVQVMLWSDYGNGSAKSNVGVAD